MPRPFCPDHLISIHAPRVGSDMLIPRLKFMRRYFNPRSPCGERRKILFMVPKSSYFNPRSPCGERPIMLVDGKVVDKFQSTLPVWGATNRSGQAGSQLFISIHAPRVGSDGNLPVFHFRLLVFQSTLPVWGATGQTAHIGMCGAISIHAPRVGSDRGAVLNTLLNRYFNPRSPCGERPALIVIGKVVSDFNPRSPCGERPGAAAILSRAKLFQSTLPVWGATFTPP